MKRRGNIIYLSAIIFVVAGILFFNNNVAENLGLKKEDQFVTMTANSQNEYVNVEDFGANGDDAKDDSTSIQEAIHFSHDSKIGTVKLLGNKRYILNKGIVLKEGIELEFGQNTTLQIEGNFKVIEVEKNASLLNGILEIVNAEFDSDVIYLDGNQKFWSWDKTRINNVTILNTSGSHKGTALHLYAGGSGNFISFVNFTDINIAGFQTGVKLEAEEPKVKNKYNFVNGNRFTNLTLDDCINGIAMNGSISIPNESSGNEFSGLQIQVSKVTKSVVKVSGSDNRFEGVIWDVHIVNKPIIEFSKESQRNRLLSNMGSKFIKDKGRQNYYTSPEEEAKNFN